jgi:hypothetical protein
MLQCNMAKRQRQSAYFYGIPGVGRYGPQQGFASNRPSANAPASPRVGGGRIIVRHNIDNVRNQTKQIPRRVEASLLEFSEQRAQRIQARMRTEMALEYRRGTGRAARGVFARVTRSKHGDKQDFVIRITNYNYREMRFLTNIGGSGTFKFGYPVQPYRIWAKGAEALAQDVVVGGRGGSFYNRSKTRFLFLKRSRDVGRLKIPADGVFLQAFKKGRGGAESRRAVGVPHQLEPDFSRPRADGTYGFKKQTDSQYFYPMWVDHPGFKRDVISDVARAEMAPYITDTKELVVVSHRTGGIRIERDSTLAVSREIPIGTSVTAYSGSVSFGRQGLSIRNISQQ